MTASLPPAVQAALSAATVSEDGLTLTLAGQLDRPTYQATAKAIEVLGGKWSRKAGAHLFTSDVREVLAGVLDGDALPKKNPLAFFATPEPLVVLMLSLLGDVRGQRVLEPSAGDGHIADALLDAGALVDVIELDDTRHGHLVGAGYQPVARDFLAFTPSERYPVIVMNPPFTAEGDAQAYITHIEHAWANCLAPGGTLVAIAPSGFTFREDRRAQAFRALVEEHGEYSPNAQNAFVESGTGVQTVTLYIRKPAPPQEVAMPVPTEQPKTTRKSKKTAAPATPAVQQEATCRETGKTFQVGEWVEYEIGGETMRGQIAEVDQQTPPFLGIARVPNHRAGRLWTQELRELRRVEAPEQAAPPAEAAPAPVTPILDGSASSLFRVEQLVASPLNPRKFFDPAAIAELAESVLHKGLMQNLVGRVAANGQDVEVVAGGRRLRALKLLAEQGRISADYLVPVRVQPLTDLEALQLATAENVERRSMTPLEEADAFAGMVALGSTPEDIALKFGYSLRTVEQRLLLARDLGDEARALLNAEKISLGQAQVVAQTTGPMREHVLKAAARGETPTTLRSMVQQASFLVEHAKFDAQASGLQVVEDLFGELPPRFADPQAALARQLDWANARAEKLRAKGKHHFVEVESTDSRYGSALIAGYPDYSTYSSYKDLAGIVIRVSTITGELKENSGVVRKKDEQAREQSERAKQKAEVASEASLPEASAIRKSGWVDGHAARAAALRTALLGDHKRAVALSILTLLSAHASAISVNWQNVEGVELPEVRARLEDLDAKLGGVLKPSTKPASGQPLLEARWAGMWNKSDEAEYTFLTQLLTLNLEELLDLLGILTAQAYGNWDKYSPEKPARAFPTRLAADVRATVKFKLTDEHLKAYTRDRLLELAADAGLAYIAGNTAKLSTNKDIRAAILQHADELHARGYVPPLARFPEVARPDPADVQYRADALALVLRLSDRQVGDLLEDLGHDPTDPDTAADALALVRQEIDDMDAGELREWAVLKRLAEELGPDATATAAD